MKKDRKVKIGEENFAAEIRKGNEEALDYIMRAYGGLLRSIILRRLEKLPHLAEECLSDTFLQIWNHIDQFRPQVSSFKNWAAGIARFKAIDYMRKYGKKAEEIRLDEVVIFMEDENLRRLIEMDAAYELEELLKCLNETDRRLFRLIYEKGLSAEEAAGCLDMKTSAIYNHLHRGREKIRKDLEERGALNGQAGRGY